MIIQGKQIAAGRRKQLTNMIEQLQRETGQVPGLAVVQVGENPASTVYVRNKQKVCAEVGIRSFANHLPENATQKDLLDLIQTLNDDPQVHGILCQLPLPSGLDEFAALCAIAPMKDVDGFHPENAGLLSIGRPRFIPGTPLGIIRLLETCDLPIQGRHCVVVGRSNIVGKPIAALLLARHGTVTITHSRTPDLAAICRQADILVVAAGKAHLIGADYVKPGAVVIDVGINRGADGKLTGDVDFAAVAPIASAITPVPGGVGPMTIAMLLENTVRAFCLQNGQSPDF